MTAATIRILLVEDDELFRLGLRIRLEQEPDFVIVAEAEDGETAIELTNRYPLDLVLLDIGLPGIGGIEACRQIRNQYPNLPVLVLTSHSQKSLIVKLIEVGARGYCLKGIPAEKLILAIRSVIAGASWWDEFATKEIRSAFEVNSQSIDPTDSSNSVNPLTQREREILELIATGKTNQEIAEILYISSGTVRVHVHAILHKLNARDRTQAVIIAMQKKLISKL
ncbi:MAG: response regulator transcription factor [Xenococcaceae cyanobacterium]